MELISMPEDNDGMTLKGEGMIAWIFAPEIGMRHFW